MMMIEPLQIIRRPPKESTAPGRKVVPESTVVSALQPTPA